MIKEDNIIVPRWFLEIVEDTLQIQHNINEPDKKKTGESCQDRNIRESLNGVRKLLDGEELTGMERLEKLRSCILSDIDKAAEEYANYNSQRWHEDGDVYYDHSKIMDAFKAGAKWMAEQGETVVGTFPHLRGYPSVIELKTYLRDYEGEDVIVQIRKKED